MNFQKYQIAIILLFTLLSSKVFAEDQPNDPRCISVSITNSQAIPNRG